MKELEEKVRNSERSDSDAFMLMAKDTTVLWASANVDKVLKIGNDQISGKRLISLAYTDKEFAEQVADAGEGLSRPLKINVGNGIFVDVNSNLVKNQFGGFSCVMSSNNVQKYAANVQKALEELVEMTSDAIINVDAFAAQLKTERQHDYAKARLFGEQAGRRRGWPVAPHAGAKAHAAGADSVLAGVERPCDGRATDGLEAAGRDSPQAGSQGTPLPIARPPGL